MSTGTENFSALIGPRIKAERERLGLTQEAAANACGVSREMWGGYERGKAAIGTAVLFHFSGAGADETYIRTGARATNDQARGEYRATPVTLEKAAQSEPPPAIGEEQHSWRDILVMLMDIAPPERVGWSWPEVVEIVDSLYGVQ